jgi:hypothetical protein
MSSASLVRLRPTDFAASISLSTSDGRRYSRDRTSLFLGRRNKLSVKEFFVLIWGIGFAPYHLIALILALSVKRSFYRLFSGYANEINSGEADGTI